MSRQDISSDFNFMCEAIKQAFELDEVPVGAVIASEHGIIAAAHNMREMMQDATAHAEIIAIKKTCKVRGSWRLAGCSLYVTLEPCPMCAGAAILSRIDRIVFGAHDPKSGVCGSLLNLPQDKRLNHRPEIVSGVLAGECADILKRFFKHKRSFD
jgi:tRNA(adenine34) deaminase